ncbi:MAG: polysaccharide deacetylase family protein [Candidatus Binataceae bacterium]
MPKHVTVCLTFDFDAFSVWLGTFKTNSPSMLSRGEFGQIGAERLLAALRDWNIRATWFIPGHTAETFPAIVEQIAADGHEIGNHGYLHENPARLSRDEEKRALDRGSAAISRITKIAPAGFRSPAADLSADTISLLLERGFLYDSSMMGNDFEPYYCRSGDVAATDGPYVFGRDSGLVEIPFTWGLDDFVAFEHLWTRHGVNPGLASPSHVYEIWSGDFDYLYERIGSGVFCLTMHPQCIGRGHRMLMLQRLVEHMRSRDGVEFRTMSEVAARWRQAHPLEP